MSLRATFATARRVLWQIRHDRRTLVLIIILPCVVLALLWWILHDRERVFQQVGPAFCGLFPLIVMFLITAITMLRERTTGTLERLMTLPIGKLDILAGYGLAFGALAAIQAVVVSVIAFTLLGLDAPHGIPLVVLLAVVNGLLGMALGLFVSAFAHTEFQAAQFMPVLIVPQLLLCGLLVPRDEMGRVLEAISWALPLTYAWDGLKRATQAGDPGFALVVDVLAMLGFTVAALVLGALTLRRRTA
jgi:ABC-2 type transport system permease protein